MLPQLRLRDIAWETGQRYPISPTTDYLAMAMVRPYFGHIHWHIRGDTLEQLRTGSDACRHAPLVVRVYDVTDVVFDGYNAHHFFDIDVGHPTGQHYFRVGQVARHYLSEIGLRCHDGSFKAAARSNLVFFDRDRPSANYQLEGLFVGDRLRRVFPVENIFDAAVYEHMNRELAGITRQESLAIGMVFVGLPGHGLDSPIGALTGTLSERLKKFAGEVRTFSATYETADAPDADTLINALDGAARTLYERVCAAHRQAPFHLLHGHDWHSAGFALRVGKTLNLPVVVSLHSTEYERAQGNVTHPLSAAICERENAAVQGADLVIVPHSSTRQQVINLYEAPPDKVVIIPDVLIHGDGEKPRDPGEIKRWFHLDPGGPMILYAGEMSHAAGVDLLVEALGVVCHTHGTAQFVLAGDGPLRGEMEARAHHLGAGHRCRFVGDIPQDTFEALLMACEFVVIPARTWQDEGLAQLAIDWGKPVLTTHQAGIRCVAHGQNGLLTYDNPGSIVWGIQELLANPLQGNMLRLITKKRAGAGPSLDSVAVQHYLYYEIVLQRRQEAQHG